MTPDEIKDLRKALGFSQQQFAAHLGASVRSVAAWEAGTAKPTKHYQTKLVRIARRQTA